MIISDLSQFSKRKLAWIPDFDSMSGATCDGNESFGGVELDIIGVEVHVENMSAYDVTKGEHVENW